ncbi:MAG: CHASE2 domain-containing protein [Ignavibacteriales bacterium]|nr:CHASE2 domain-containing protein [Ignavibacteriales bacterium]
MTSPWFKRIMPWLIRILLSLGIALLVLVFVQDAVVDFKLFDRLKLSFIDRSFSRRGPLPIPKESLDVVIVTISDKSENSVPHQFPFPRNYYARAVRNLNRAGARAIGIDLTFEQPDANGPKYDQELFDAIRTYRNVVVAGKTEIKIAEASIKRTDENYHTIFYPADSSVGVVYVPEDEDGIFRRYVPFAKVPGEETYVPTFAFALLNKYLRLPSTAACSEEGTAFYLGGRHIPKYDDVSMLINYHGPADKTFKQLDIVEVLDDSTFETKEERAYHTQINAFDDPDIGRLYDGTFKNKVVLIGPAFPESKDLFPVPISDPSSPNKILMYGVELHANALQTLISQNFITRLPRWSEFLYTIIISIITFLFVSALKVIKAKYQIIVEIAAVLFILGEVILIILVSQNIFSARFLILPVVSPIAAVFANYLGCTVYQYLTERKQKVMIKGMFSQYLNPTVVNELIAHPEKLRLGGERKELTVLFSDIAGFTSFSESLPPEELVLLLNEYLSAMTDIVFKHDGTLDKYEGDAVMAFWGAPIELDNNAVQACAAAVEMQEEIDVLREKWTSEGKPDIHVRIGLNTGDMVVGNMGGRGKFDYTVIGDSVNLGSRLEGANKQYGTYMMVSERTQDLAKEKFVFRELDLLVVKGKTKPIKVFELIGRNDGSIPQSRLDAVAAYSIGLRLYRQRDFAGAIAQFQNALTINPDAPSGLYIERAQFYLQSPPSPDWDGVFVLKTK